MATHTQMQPLKNFIDGDWVESSFTQYRARL